MLRLRKVILLKKFFSRWEGKLRKYADRYLFRRDLENDIEFQKIYQRVGPRHAKYTMTSMERWQRYVICANPGRNEPDTSKDISL